MATTTYKVEREQDERAQAVAEAVIEMLTLDELMLRQHGRQETPLTSRIFHAAMNLYDSTFETWDGEEPDPIWSAFEVEAKHRADKWLSPDGLSAADTELVAEGLADLRSKVRALVDRLPSEEATP